MHPETTEILQFTHISLVLKLELEIIETILQCLKNLQTVYTYSSAY